MDKELLLPHGFMSTKKDDFNFETGPGMEARSSSKSINRLSKNLSLSKDLSSDSLEELGLDICFMNKKSD